VVGSFWLRAVIGYARALAALMAGAAVSRLPQPVWRQQML